jgi:methylated-DNA-[protein]-cysteine S-methyltransferase
LKEFIFYYHYRKLTLHLVSDEYCLRGVHFSGRKTSTEITEETPDPLKKAADWLNCYFRLSSDVPPEIVPVSPDDKDKILPGSADYENRLFLDMTGFSQKEISVYKSLLKVPAGDTISYGLLAEVSGIPSGARFAGNCMAKNRFPLFIPCHRVIKADGTWGNFTGGTGIKEYLLEYESGD